MENNNLLKRIESLKCLLIDSISLLEDVIYKADLSGGHLGDNLLTLNSRITEHYTTFKKEEAKGDTDD